jgi:uncharacterized protein involved in response to NO
VLNKLFCSLWSIGFRPFFLLAAASSVVFMAIWGGMIAHGNFPQNYYNPVSWHAHEMLFGYTVAVLSGFLLTAVKNWTGRETAEGAKLAALAVLWLLGRAVPFMANILDGWLIALVDLAFLPCLILYLAIPIWQQAKLRNVPVLLLLLGMFVSNVLFHLDVLKLTAIGVGPLSHLVIGIILIFITIIAGRVVPFFIKSGSPGSIPVVWPLVEWVSVLSIVVLMILKPFYYGSYAFLACCAVAMASNTIRMTGWYCKGIYRLPMLWVLFSGYLWMIVGVSLDFLSVFDIVPPQLALHAMTAGAIGVLTLGMMCRVSLGHTGRAIKANAIILATFLSINAAVFFRVIVPLFMPADYVLWLTVSSGLWLMAFLLFFIYFTPVLLRRRIDEA